MSEVWLDQMPQEPPLVACVKCADPLLPGEVFITYTSDGMPVHPLCPQCYRLEVDSAYA
jgi:hypothetical protein